MKKQIRVLVVGYEVAPFYKRGGLGDVMGSLPKALREIEVDARIVVPFYDDIRKQKVAEKIGEFEVIFESQKKTIGVYRTYFTNQRVPIYFLANEAFLYIERMKGKEKIEHFGFFSFAVGQFTYWLQSIEGFRIDIIHCNDWHVALIPFILQKKFHSHIASLLTIHNLFYQGHGAVGLLEKFGILDLEALELKKGRPATELNVLGEGFLHADRISTVSPTYAKEISDTEDSKNPINLYIRRRVEEYGKKDKIVGILNGIDYHTWNPETDNDIYPNFGVRNWNSRKAENKEKLLVELNLPDRPTICFVGRMASQKGLDIVARAAKQLMSLDLNLIFLGQGNVKIVEVVHGIAKQHKEKIRFIDAFSEEFSHRLYASSDFILIPSHYEPCGLIQMIAMRYGTVPIASDTGGLHDSILNGKDGFLFKKNSSRSLIKGVKKALHAYSDKNRFNRMVERAMKKDFSWKKSALLYKKLYKDILSS